MICGFRWHAPRREVPGSVPVEHMCCKEFHYDDFHTCFCGARTVEEE